MKMARWDSSHEWSCETNGYMIFRKKGRKMVAFYRKKQNEYMKLSHGMIA